MIWKNVTLVIILFVIILFLCGCWDQIEIEKNAFILGIGLDKSEDGLLNITYQIAVPSGVKGESEEKKKRVMKCHL
ncbi:MAG TPA: hypothetical protein GX392_04950 [Clostridiales bacterium]|nr:hypothetical protein [Clostridiales bacterium]